ncbi:type I DNA topoisomerase [Sandaracinus amylolyticus]|uniref:type I DNA topoisomerase n=1 Tax=Sandaracinus amylolyticus TaxID=927083 RepID=UPI001F000C7E|nr:type I DNA topoisomerase [Sandaracinus amylolyticus]
MTKSLVIVESPAKARTIAGFLGDGYVVESSIGHIRDLPKSADDVPPALKKVPWAKLGVDVENDFKPLYVVDADKKQHIQRLKQLLKDADELYLATDEDREGESIAWHLYEVLQPKVPVRRMVFHEITRKAIQQALSSPREIDRRLVEAQEARRILDRLFGYEVSPVLWKKILPKLSAGRVQSVATRVLVERERERMRFVTAKYWDLDALIGKKDGSTFDAGLVSVGGARVASGKDFNENGKLTKSDVVLLDEAQAKTLADGLRGQPMTVRSVERKPYKRSPSAPFMTSTLQQEAGRKLRFSTSRTMKAAQRLYENGYITYMRTDSTTLSEAALTAARRLIEEMYGREYVPSAPRTYANKVKNAQEAHEAIRPAGDTWKTPEDVSREVGPDEAKVYELVWKRTVASQMQDVRGESIVVKIAGKARDGRDVEFSVSGNTIQFAGFYRAYVEGSDDPEAELESREKHLPELVEGESLVARELKANGHETQPPARYTEASLVRRLEELGVGRPSTYASTLSTIQDRGYVFKKGTALYPSWTAFAVVSLLEKHFPELVDYAFTARMEDDLDEIANGAQNAVPWLRRFYFGEAANEGPNGAGGDNGLKTMVSENLGEIDARAVNSIPIGVDPNGVEIVARVGRYGPYLQRGEDTVSIPEELAPDELTVEKSLALLTAPSGDREVGKDPETGLSVFVKAGRFGTYVQLGEATKDGEKPKTASLFSSMKADTLTLEQALKLLSLPRTVGNDPADGVAITAQNGRYGPYVQKGTESRSLESEDQIFTVTTEQALALLAQPKTRGPRRAAATGPLKELGVDPVSQKPIVLREGRFGPYVSDGDTVASLRKGDTIDGITPERAQELLAERRERGPSTKSKRGRGGAKAKAAASEKPAAEKKAPAKKAAKKASTKKAAAKKASAKKGDDGDGAEAEESRPAKKRSPDVTAEP